jgi:hypothetical protein
VSTDPYALWDDLAALWSRALALASDAAVPWPVRGRAASLCRALAFEIAEDDARALVAVSAASTCIERLRRTGSVVVSGRCRS